LTEYVHPETGEVLASEEEWRAALAAVEERLGLTYRALWKLREYTEHFAPVAADMPAQRRNRTETQEKVARCPRCGGRLEKDEG
jgi:uncharacterized protein with PIN domain